MELFNREKFDTLSNKYERAAYLLKCEKEVAMIAVLSELEVTSCEPTVVVLTDQGESITLNFMRDEDKDYTDAEMVEHANERLQDIIDSVV
ncbi:hypothetical protein VPHD51_0166 [Vibrio phage D51]